MNFQIRKRFKFNGKRKTSAIVISGVNGVGKTTSIGKLESILKKTTGQWFLGPRTLKAAAIDQLQIWAQKSK